MVIWVYLPYSEDGPEWKKGKELIWNVIQPCKLVKIEIKPLSEYEKWEFELNWNKVEVADNKAKGKKRSFSEIFPDENEHVGAKKFSSKVIYHLFYIWLIVN